MEGPVAARVGQLLQEQEPLQQLALNRVCIGNPGTGKTTIGRLVAELLTALGKLPKGHLVETDRAGLVAPYCGQTALKVQEIVRSAIGGMLFEVHPGAEVSFDKEVVALEKEGQAKASLCRLGKMSRRMVVAPNLDDLLEQVQARLDAGWDGKAIPGISNDKLHEINTLDRRMR